MTARQIAGLLASGAAVLLGAHDPAVAEVGSGPPLVCARDLAVEPSGTIVVTGGCPSLGPVSVLRIDPATGDRTVVSDVATGTGPALVVPIGIDVDGHGDLLVLDYSSRAVLRVDPVTGDRTVLTDDASGGGIRLLTVLSIAAEPSGGVLVGDGGATATGYPLPYTQVRKALVRVDPISGHRTIASGGGFFSGRVGGGPGLLYPEGLAVMPDGTIAVTSGRATKKGVARVDPVTGDRTVLAGGKTGSGAALEYPVGIAVEAAGTLAIVDISRGVLRLDPATRVRVVIADETRGQGPPVGGGWAIDVEADGSLLVLKSTSVLRVNPATGDRTVVSEWP
jgi:hypothetical protein